MDQRKYFNSRIHDLEGIYQDGDGDVAVLEELEEELQHRSTDRAKKLLNAVQIKLNDDVALNPKSEPPKEHISRPKVKMSIPAKPSGISCSSSAEKLIDWVAVLDGSDVIRSSSGEAKKEHVFPNKPEDIIDAWTVLEALSPQSYKKPNDLVIGQGSVAYLKKGQEPWVFGEKSRPKNNLYYMAFLGSVDIEKATQKLLALYQDKRIEKSASRGLAALGVILLDKTGVPIPDTGLALSSFGWSYARALEGKLHQLKSWEVAEQALKDGLEKLIYREDEDGKKIPLSLDQMQRIHLWIIKNCGITLDDVVEPSFVIRLYQPFSKGEPEPPLLNSFYLGDLQHAKRAVQSKSCGDALSLYLGISKPNKCVDILRNKQYIEEALQPKFTSTARWPSNGRHSLVLLQQVAVNLAKTELVNGGLFSVNGPPGTGKTTLLRDVVASVLVDRARALCAFSNTDDAFEHAGQMKLGKGFVHIYKLDQSLRGHEILVASTNNKAVENVSKELPLKTQIASDISEFEYFKTVSDALSSNNEETWGLSAAVLGNSKNRGNFINKAWWDSHSGLRNYFLSITGQLNLEIDDDGEEIIPKIIEECDPPSSIEEANKRWSEARVSFREALDKAQDAINKSQEAYESSLEVGKLEIEVDGLLTEQNSFKAKIKTVKKRASEVQALLDKKNRDLETAMMRESRSKKLKPGILKRIFSRSEWKLWKNDHQNLVFHRALALKEYKALQNQGIECSDLLSKTNHALASKQDQIKSHRSKCKRLVSEIDKVSSICGGRLVSDDLWSLDHKDQQNFSPNFTNEAQRLRDDVFVAAIRLHKAFIDASSKQLRQNLGLFFSCLGGKHLPEEKQALLPHLWSSAFLLTPVMSTAFASVGRMLKTMPKESIGWLLIDEAGQATPQAAIGAIYRSKRVVCVGDPLQIEPVVTLPSELVEAISKHLGVDPHNWVAPDASVQTLSDKANSFGATIPRDLSEIRIGSPLLVHRRCENPMFTISNRLAYNGLMVQATVPQKSQITELYGVQSKWFDIQGSAQEKWCPEEGEHVTEMLLNHFSTCNGNPEIFVISPFKIVAERMRQRIIVEESRMVGWGIENPSQWAYNNIGTVHTFQGKETKAVIFILGAPSSAQNGARTWATSNVNLLNVAVSRAKQNFYIVGNKALWHDLGNMKLVSRYIEK